MTNPSNIPPQVAPSWLEADDRPLSPAEVLALLDGKPLSEHRRFALIVSLEPDLADQALAKLVDRELRALPPAEPRRAA
jgi:hypothetical protein